MVYVFVAFLINTHARHCVLSHLLAYIVAQAIFRVGDDITEYSWDPICPALGVYRQYFKDPWDLKISGPRDLNRRNIDKNPNQKIMDSAVQRRS